MFSQIVKKHGQRKPNIKMHKTLQSVVDSLPCHNCGHNSLHHSLLFSLCFQLGLGHRKVLNDLFVSPKLIVHQVVENNLVPHLCRTSGTCFLVSSVNALEKVGEVGNWLPPLL